MNRKDFFENYYAMPEDTEAQYFEQEYRFLKNYFETLPHNYLDELENLPHPPEKPGDYILFGGVKVPANDRIANARDVAQHYRYRLASEFSQGLPDFFRRVLMLADDIEMMDLLMFGTMGVLSACMPGVSGSLFQEQVTPNLYLFITGNAAAGKGKIGLCRKLLEPLNASYLDAFIIPANSTDTALYEQLSENGGRGIIFESEADTLTAAFKKGSGKFSDGLRAAFHNEPITYLRRKEHEHVVINHPELSVVLTGTPGQVPLLLTSPENGLFSRFMFYRLSAEREAFAANLQDHGPITGEMVNDYLLQMGEELKAFYRRLSTKKGGIRFRLTPEQESRFMEHFHDATQEYKDLYRQGYETEEAANHADSIMKRLGNICYRMMMVLSVSRLISTESSANGASAIGEGSTAEASAVKPQELPSVVECHPIDFERVLAIEPILRYHNHIHYDEMMVAAGAIAPLGEEEITFDEQSDDAMNEKQRSFFAELPKEFTTQVAIEAAKKFGISARSTARYLTFYCDLGLLKCKCRGSYIKMQ